MQPSTSLRAIHKPLIRFLGPRVNLWKGIFFLGKLYQNVTLYL